MIWCRRQQPVEIKLETWFDWAAQGAPMATLDGREWRLDKELSAMRLYSDSPRGYFRFTFPSKHEATKFRLFWN